MNNRFKRYEKKFYLSTDKFKQLKELLQEKIIEDDYHKYTIRNVYYDDDTYRVIRHSISNPVFKQKLRLRSYDSENVFFEIKKKYRKEVSKRRVVLPMNEFYKNDFSSVEDTQTLSEIQYFLKHEKIYPKVLLQYDREAYQGIEDCHLRITFDSNLFFSTNVQKINQDMIDKKDRLDGNFIMEVKARNSIPLWFSHILDELQIYSRPFSKYGHCYKNYILKNKQKEGMKHV